VTSFVINAEYYVMLGNIAQFLALYWTCDAVVYILL